MTNDDEAWESLLDNLSFDDMSKLVALGGYQTTTIGKIGKVQTVELRRTFFNKQ